MRKHNHPPVLRRVIAGGALALVFVACTDARQERSVATAAQGNQVGTSKDAAPRMAVADNAPASARALAVEGQAKSGEGVKFASDVAGAMLIRHGEASLEVAHVDDALAQVRRSAAQFGGFVANTTIRNGKEERPSATLEIRVPSAQFDGLLAALGSLGKVETVTANVQDVGEEYVDMGARATNAKRMEARLIEMLATRTGKLDEVLTVEQELRRVREEIERYEARLRYLEKHASVSSLDITLHEPLALIDRPRPGPIVVAIGLAWERTLGVIAWCIASLGVIVPLGVLIGLGVVAYRWLQVPRFREE
ncbi:MAG: DUF4349 domain-containing protein [Gemmatimonadaceae bacterium]